MTWCIFARWPGSKRRSGPRKEATLGIRVVRLGTARQPGEGLRLGTVRRLPRGVRKENYARDNWFDLWLPELAPSTALLSYATKTSLTPARWTTFSKRYRSEMKEPGRQRLIALLAAQSHQADFSIGCYCADPRYCHRMLLAELFREAKARLVP
jgi:uncharacterized protein YeaO (DUF488 family)